MLHSFKEQYIPTNVQKINVRFLQFHPIQVLEEISNIQFLHDL